MSKYALKLYITGQTPRSLRAIENLRRICEEELGGDFDLKIIDVLEQPQLANEDKILATPTLIKLRPVPSSRIIGDLSDLETVRLGLDIPASAGTMQGDKTGVVRNKHRKGTP